MVFGSYFYAHTHKPITIRKDGLSDLGTYRCDENVIYKRISTTTSNSN
jgi:hypothetical protein